MQRTRTRGATVRRCEKVRRRYLAGIQEVSRRYPGGPETRIGQGLPGLGKDFKTGGFNRSPTPPWFSSLPSVLQSIARLEVLQTSDCKAAQIALASRRVPVRRALGNPGARLA